jgi:hypothetical protein
MEIVYKTKKSLKKNDELNEKLRQRIIDNDIHFDYFIEKKESKLKAYNDFMDNGYLKMISDSHKYKPLILADIVTKNFSFSEIGNSCYHPSNDINNLIYGLVDNNYGQILREIYGGEFVIGSILYHKSDWEHQGYKFYTNKCDNHIKFCHVDTTPPSFMKIMYYLTENVDIDNGCFQVIPKSHTQNKNKMDWLIRKSVKDLRLTDSNNIYKLYPEYQKSHTFLIDYDDNNDYFLKIKENLVSFNTPYDFILFNPMMIHTGGYVYKGKREALQIVIKKKV